MSQPRNPADSQALLQSMLQRLKLQTGREGQAHTPVPTTGASIWRQGGERGACDVQKMNNSPVNGFGANGVPSKEFGISAGDSNHGMKGGEVQQLAHGCAVDRGVISSPTQKDNIDGDTGENRAPAVTPTGTEQLFPARSLKDADITSFERTHVERGSFGTSAMTKQTANNKEAVTGTGQNQDQGFTPKVYMWSLKPTDASLDTGGQEGQVPHVGNGGLGALAQSKDMQIVPTSQKTTNSSSRRKQRPSENKTARRWTQKIKERWRDRPGSFGKKGKEEGGREDKESEQKTEISPQNQLLAVGRLTDTPNKEEERALTSLGSSNHTEGSTSEGHIRSIGDFEFGLGSFSLLEEIVMGQEWAKFLNPGQSAASAYQRPSEEPLRHFTIPSNPHDSGQSSLTLNQLGGVNNQWSFGATKASPDFSMAQVSPDAFLPVSMDVTEGKQQQYNRREADQSEPMEHGHTRRPPSLVEPANILINSALKTRVQLNRKRQYQSAERRDERLQTEKTSHVSEADRGGSTPSQGQTSSHPMEEAGGSERDDVIPLYTLNSPSLPLSPTSFPPYSPRGVLKHSISHDSEASMETVTKRRRVEENRRVRFSEEILTIAPPELDLDATDSEEDSEAEEDSVIEQECEEVPAPIEEVAPARRHALPAWILALKRRNTGRKHR
ncbi:hypothetical protein L3Q82_020550 [Scortum barcoo]|uniref:Uncharacterized protein n=1 Tax=Scortum barcoo TaxID=214431 RepID=A0ACB8V8B9_9TELE|nr:hypothetical protein L3Q82_020550 [Scortum barcoo]